MEEFNVYEEMAKVDRALLEVIKANLDFAEIYIEEMHEPSGPSITLPRMPTAEEWSIAKR